MPSRSPTRRRATTGLAVILLVMTGLGTACSRLEPAPVPTTVAPSPPSAEELAAEAAAEAEAEAEAADATIALLPGVAEAVVRIGQATAERPHPAVTLVRFASGTPVDQLRSGVTTILDVLGASGLALDHVELMVDRADSGTLDDLATWTGAGVGPSLAQEAQLWVNLIELSADARSSTLTHEGLDPLRIRAFPVVFDGELPTSGAVYLGLVDACVAIGIDPATAQIVADMRGQVQSWQSTPIDPAFLTAVEQVDILDYVHLGGVTRSDNRTEVTWMGSQGTTLTQSQQLALLGPLEHVGLLTDDLIVTLFTDAGELIQVWPPALA